MRSAVVIVGLLLAGGTAPARPRGATLAVECTVNGATVEVDGRVVGRTPLAPLTLAAGTHVVTVRKLGHLPHSEKVDARPGAKVSITADLLPFAGVLLVSSDVDGARVSLDGEVLGRVPGEYEIEIGKHVIVVSAPGRVQHSETLVVNAGEMYEVAARLREPQASGSLDLDLEPLAPTGPAARQTKARAAADADAPFLELPAPDPDLAPLTPARRATNATEPPAAGPDGSRPTRGAAGPSAPSPGPFVGQEIPAPEPWYKRYWAWGAAAGALVAGGVVVAALVARGDDTCVPTWEPGKEFKDCSP